MQSRVNAVKKRAQEKDIEIGFHLYQLDPKKPLRQRPSSLPPVSSSAHHTPAPAQSKRNPGGVVVPAAPRSSSVSSRRSQSKPPTPLKNSPLVPSPPQAVGQRGGNPRKLIGRQAVPHGGRIPSVGPSPKAVNPASVVFTDSHDVVVNLVNYTKDKDNFSTALVGGEDEEKDEGQRSLSSSLRPPSNYLEESFHYLLSVDQQELPSEAVGVLTLVSKALKHDRKLKQGQQPFQRLALFANEKDPGVKSLMLALAEAAQASTSEEAAARLTEEVQEKGGSGKRKKAMCLVNAAWAELQLEVILNRPSEELADLGKISECFQLLDTAIEMGHIGAMHYIGCCLRDGRGVKVDLVAGVSWIEKAAHFGYVPAIHEMGEILENGIERDGKEIDSDWGEALEWYSKAAEHNFVLSQLNLGKLLLTACMHSGETEVSAEENEAMMAKALDWLDLAAAAGNQEAIRLRERI